MKRIFEYPEPENPTMQIHGQEHLLKLCRGEKLFAIKVQNAKALKLMICWLEMTRLCCFHDLLTKGALKREPRP